VYIVQATSAEGFATRIRVRDARPSGAALLGGHGPANVRAYTYHILFASAERLLAIGGSEKAGSRGIKDEAIG
jgi:hypothetical protein